MQCRTARLVWIKRRWRCADPRYRPDTGGCNGACPANAALNPTSSDVGSYVAINAGGDIVATGAAALAYGAAGVAAGLPLAAAGVFLIGYGINEACYE